MSPTLPVPLNGLVHYINGKDTHNVFDLLQPYYEHEKHVRKLFAQDPTDPLVSQPNVNVLSLFDKDAPIPRVRARKVAVESTESDSKFIMPLKQDSRRPHGSPAVVSSFKTFQDNFNLFSELSLTSMDWSNVVCCGSAVTTSLMPVPEEHSGSRKSVRNYYHDKIAPASDVDLFLYGLTDEEAMEKIRQIETAVRDSLLVETTTIRTKNAITIASEYPVRHVQIVLRVYKNISEILTGFDVDCSCAAYDGSNVYCTPRALGSFITQINRIDLTRRSPSYENRLSKYSRRGFEVFWPQLDRSRIDPTIFERSFNRTVGLARLLVLETLPEKSARESYMEERRRDRGRPVLNSYWSMRHTMRGNVKEEQVDEVAEWMEEDMLPNSLSSYSTFTIPYGRRWTQRRIERLLYSQDLLLNASWNKPKDREVNLHRHPAFFGDFQDIMHDCCGTCPKPSTPEEIEVAAEETRVYVSGTITFLRDDPGRQEIGSFNPIDANDWTEMAYISETQRLCQAIVDGNLQFVRQWCQAKDNDVNARDYTGRTPLQLAVQCSTLDVVQCLIDNNARMVARLADGRTALHLAAIRGSASMVRALLQRSEKNEEEDEARKDGHRTIDVSSPLEQNGKKTDTDTDSDEDSEIEMVDPSDDDMALSTASSYVQISREDRENATDGIPADSADDPDVFDVDVVSWDSPSSALHYAIVNGHEEVVRMLVQEFGADVLAPVKLTHTHNKQARAAILTLVLASRLAEKQATSMMKLLLDLGATSTQSDLKGATALHRVVAAKSPGLQTLLDHNQPAAKRAVRHMTMSDGAWRPQAETPLMTAIVQRDANAALSLLRHGASPDLPFETWVKVYISSSSNAGRLSTEENRKKYLQYTNQPIILALQYEVLNVVESLLDAGGDVNTLLARTHDALINDNRFQNFGSEDIASLLDLVERRIESLRKAIEPFEEDEKPQSIIRAIQDDLTRGFWRNKLGSRAKSHIVKLLEPLREDYHYLNGLKPDSYHAHSARLQLKDWKRLEEEQKEIYKREKERREKERPLRRAKLVSLQEAISALDRIRGQILSKGGKTIEQLYPGRFGDGGKNAVEDTNMYAEGEEVFKLAYTFLLGDINDAQQAGYEELFEAAWIGDVEKIRSLTLSAWGADKQPPLRAHLTDSRGLSPFMIAALRGHYDTARDILEIVAAQWSPKDPPKKRRYRIRSEHVGLDEWDSEDEYVDMDNDSSDEMKLTHEEEDPEYTKDDIDVSERISSHTTALDVLMGRLPARDWHYVLNLDLPSNVEIFMENSSGPHAATLLTAAILSSNERLLRFYIETGKALNASKNPAHKLQEASSEPRDEKWFAAASSLDVQLALRYGKTDLLTELVKNCGALLPIYYFARKSGVDLQPNEHEYKGLAIHGRKHNKNKHEETSDPNKAQDERNDTMLLRAAFNGDLKSLEWAFSQTPLRNYAEFAHDHQDDARLQALSKSNGDLKKQIIDWFTSRSELAVHCVVMSANPDRLEDRLRFALSTAPNCAQAQSSEGLTPIALAFMLRRPKLVSILIEASADQTCRTYVGENILHLLLNRTERCNSVLTTKKKEQHDCDATAIEELLDLIDSRLIETLWTERMKDEAQGNSYNPIAQWLQRVEDDSKALDVLRLLLRRAPINALWQVTGSGDTPLHFLVRSGKLHFAEELANTHPELLFRENAVGLTPVEVAAQAWQAQHFADPPHLDVDRGYSYWGYGRGEWSLATQDLDYFDPSKSKDESKSKAVKMWEKIQELLVKHAGRPRTLVSLLEANEVAKRLAERQKGNNARAVQYDGYYNRYGSRTLPPAKDEVAAWIGHHEQDHEADT